jgi:uncharacterized membrane protein YfcA
LITPAHIVLFIAVGSLCGFLAGFFGIGGGIILVPMLALFFRSTGVVEEILMQLTFGTSLAVAFLASGSSTLQHHRQKSLSWPAVGIMALGSIIGAWTGTNIAVRSSSLVLKLVFTISLATAALGMFFEKRMTSKEIEPKFSLLWVFSGFVSGFIAPMAGIGGGIILVPLMIYLLHFPIKKVVGTSSGVIIFTSAISTIQYISLGRGNALLPEGCFGFVCPSAVIFLGISSMTAAPFGAKFNQKIKNSFFKKIFGILLLLISIKILFTKF